MGKRIVITSFGSLGDIYPYLALARQPDDSVATMRSSPPLPTTARSSRRKGSPSVRSGPISTLRIVA